MPEFRREIKKLSKRFPTLEEDLKTFIQYPLNLFHYKNVNNNTFVNVPGLCSSIPFYKVKKFACRSLKGRGAKSGIRLIYCYLKKEDKAVFIEIYFKGDKENEDRGRIKKYCAKISIKQTYP